MEELINEHQFDDSLEGKDSDGSFQDGHWNSEELFRFISFMIFNRQALKLKLQRRTQKIFKQMSEFVGTRSAVQCRSQNQRLFRKFKNMRTIITAFQKDYGKIRFEQEYKMVSQQPGIRFRTGLSEEKKEEGVDQWTQTEPMLEESLVRAIEVERQQMMLQQQQRMMMDYYAAMCNPMIFYMS